MTILRHLQRTLVAYIALFVALSSTAYAAKPLITGADIADNTVASVDVTDADLGANDVAPNALTGAVVDESTLSGVDADRLDGKSSEAFVQNHILRSLTWEWGPTTVATGRSVLCETGEAATGGGWQRNAPGGSFHVTESRPAAFGTRPVGWFIDVVNDGYPDTGGSMIAYVICAQKS